MHPQPGPSSQCTLAAEKPPAVETAASDGIQAAVALPGTMYHETLLRQLCRPRIDEEVHLGSTALWECDWTATDLGLAIQSGSMSSVTASPASPRTTQGTTATTHSPSRSPRESSPSPRTVRPSPGSAPTDAATPPTSWTCWTVPTSSRPTYGEKWTTGCSSFARVRTTSWATTSSPYSTVSSERRESEPHRPTDGFPRDYRWLEVDLSARPDSGPTAGSRRSRQECAGLRPVCGPFAARLRPTERLGRCAVPSPGRAERRRCGEEGRGPVRLRLSRAGGPRRGPATALQGLSASVLSLLPK